MPELPDIEVYLDCLRPRLVFGFEGELLLTEEGTKKRALSRLLKDDWPRTLEEQERPRA